MSRVTGVEIHAGLPFDPFFRGNDGFLDSRTIQAIRDLRPLCIAVSLHRIFSLSFGSLYILSFPSSVNLLFITFFIAIFYLFRPALLLTVYILYRINSPLRPQS